MTKKLGTLAVVLFLFIYTAWDFYNGALRYDPLADVSVRNARTRALDLSSPKYQRWWGKDIYEKNLFSPDRGYVPPKPYVPPAPPPPPPPPPPRRPEMELKGIVLDPYGDLVAYLSIDKGKAVPLRKGDKTDDIELVDINERAVVLKWNGENINISLERIRTITNPRMAR